jgi:hypothetical protein
MDSSSQTGKGPDRAGLVKSRISLDKIIKLPQFECMNHLKQIGLAALQHESVYGRFPGGGWTGRWLGELDRGTDRNQPGGWIYQLLRFMEQDNLAAWGAGLSRAQQLNMNSQRASHPVAMLICPSRRGIGPFSNDGANRYFNGAGLPELLAHSDYAACATDRAAEELVACRASSACGFRVEG